jgi:hypothetical protein
MFDVGVQHRPDGRSWASGICNEAVASPAAPERKTPSLPQEREAEASVIRTTAVARGAFRFGPGFRSVHPCRVHDTAAMLDRSPMRQDHPTPTSRNPPPPRAAPRKSPARTVSTPPQSSLRSLGRNPRFCVAAAVPARRMPRVTTHATACYGLSPLPACDAWPRHGLQDKVMERGARICWERLSALRARVAATVAWSVSRGGPAPCAS